MSFVFWYCLAALGEIAGCFSFWAWLRQGKSIFWLLPGCLALAIFAAALTRIDSANAGRTYATYGGVYRTIQDNLMVGVGVVHVCGITAALLGWICPIQVATLHLGSDVLVFLNSIKLLRVRIKSA